MRVVCIVIVAVVWLFLFGTLTAKANLKNRNQKQKKRHFVMQRSISEVVFMGLLLLPHPVFVFAMKAELQDCAISVFKMEIISYFAIWIPLLATILYVMARKKIVIDGDCITIQVPFRKDKYFSFYDITKVSRSFFGRHNNYLYMIYVNDCKILTFGSREYPTEMFFKRLKEYDHIVFESW